MVTVYSLWHYSLGNQMSTLYISSLYSSGIYKQMTALWLHIPYGTIPWKYGQMSTLNLNPSIPLEYISKYKNDNNTFLKTLFPGKYGQKSTLYLHPSIPLENISKCMVTLYSLWHYSL